MLARGLEITGLSQQVTVQYLCAAMEKEILRTGSNGGYQVSDVVKQGTSDWFKSRVGRITGSSVGAILGVDPWRSADDVLRAMVRSYHGAESEFTGNIATEYGNRMEPEAVEQFKLESGLNVEEVGFFPYEDWAGASPDGKCIDGNGLEVKCPFGKRKGGDFKSLDEQPHYYAQMQFEALCSGFPAVWFYQWSPYNSKLELVEKDQDWLDENLPKLRQFYAFYLSELDNPEHLSPKRVTVNTQETKRLLDEYDQLKEAVANATERQKEVQEELVKACGERDAEAWGRKITLVEKAGAVSYAKVVKEHLPKLDLEPYRGKSSIYWKVT